MTREPKWISRKSTLAIHEMLLAEHGGAPGIIAEDLLESALDSPRNQFAYTRTADIFDLAAVCARALTQDHPFVDGNKRIALTVALTILERNGVIVAASEAEAVEMVLGLSSGDIGAPAFAEWLRSNRAKLSPKRAPRSPATAKKRPTRPVRKKK